MTEQLEQFDIKTRVHFEFIRDSGKMKIQELNHHQKSVSKIILNKAGTVFATCADDHYIHLYNAITFQLIRSYKMGNAVKNIIFMNTEDKIITSNSLGSFSIFEYFKDSDEPFYNYENFDTRNLCIGNSFGDKYLSILTMRLFSNDDEDEVDDQVKCYIYKIDSLKINKMNTFLESITSCSSNDDTENFEFVIFGLKEEEVFIACQTQICKYQINEEEENMQLENTVFPYLGKINSLKFTPKYEFLLASCQNGVSIIKGLTFEVYNNIRTDYPVWSAQLSNLAYDLQFPKFHLVFGGGIDVMEQAYSSEGGNEINIYDIRTAQKLCTIGGCNARINDLTLFKDGSGVIVANADGKATIFRFDISYYDKEDEIKKLQ